MCTCESHSSPNGDRNLQQCANMRDNNLNKYPITHFIMHIVAVLSLPLLSSALLRCTQHNTGEEMWRREKIRKCNKSSEDTRLQFQQTVSRALDRVRFTRAPDLRRERAQKQTTADANKKQNEKNEKMWLKLIQMINQIKFMPSESSEENFLWLDLTQSALLCCMHSFFASVHRLPTRNINYELPL